MAKTATQTGFQTQVLKRLEGETKEQTAVKIERLATSVIQGQISALEGSIVEKEIAVENAQEAATDALYPTTVSALSDKEGFVRNIVNTKEAVAKAEKDLQATKDLVETLKAVLTEYK